MKSQSEPYDTRDSPAPIKLMSIYSMQNEHFCYSWLLWHTAFFQIKFSLGFITSCYVIFSLSMVQAMDIFMIT